MGHVVTKGVFELQEILELQKKIVPELVNTLEKGITYSEQSFIINL